MIEHGVNRQLLGSAKPGCARLPPRATLRWNRRAQRFIWPRRSIAARRSRPLGFADRDYWRLVRRTVRRRIAQPVLALRDRWRLSCPAPCTLFARSGQHWRFAIDCH